MQKTTRTKKPTTAEAIAKMADQKQNIMKFYKGEGRMVQPIQCVNVVLPETIKIVNGHERGN